ncbi:hypothetical protein IE81DRAFT_198657 [Ceraceosorus guamensis]|uniref:Uncharacterized protein n=1 Tax=Ceraceosorus guamensis TaxID=1522189 RepID=A0A316VWZ9_9BASI|nr:hypothetical protein IE81DRAFT_198657 [Ceraceosorus guamensis]PWN40973.1 hypothetical protein IE81DRAFT_198657 [Ceraceosorus guamensis]
MAAQRDPIFLERFLRLSLPEMPKHPFPADYQAPYQVAPPLKTTSKVHLVPWRSPSNAGEASSLSFKEAIEAELSSLDDAAKFQHVLPPAAFRKGDLPEVTLLHTVHLWCIVQVWQPFLRVLNLEDEVALGGFDSTTSKQKGALHIGDHLPVHASSGVAIPRQLVFRSSQAGNILAPVCIHPPWNVTLSNLAQDQEVQVDDQTSSNEPHVKALRDAIAFMQAADAQHAVVSTYDEFVFLKSVEGGKVQVSPVIKASDTDLTVYMALWYWCRDVARQS